MSVANCSTVVGVFDERSEADQAIYDLGKAGFRSDQIGVVTRDPERATVVRGEAEAETDPGGGVILGAVTGAGIGSLVGLGVLAGVVPVIGPALAAGTLATILTNAAGGAAIAGLGGALMGWGVPEEHAKYYDSEFQAGRVVVTVHAEDRCDTARTILESHGGYNHESVVTSTVRI
ncbi:MAG: general stress protein [Pirellulaceae bacterium]